MKSRPIARASRLGIRSGIVLAVAALSRAAAAGGDGGAKTFIDYIRPTPMACPLTSKTWGCTATAVTTKQNYCDNEAKDQTSGPVVPRDTCNGMESPMAPPAYYYWDGKIIRSADGVYHLFADRWAGSTGFNPGWQSSAPIHAVSDGGPLGPFTDMGYAYSYWSTGSDSHRGHNSSACQLLDGSYCLYTSEVVPFTIFTSISLDGPWTACPEPTPNMEGEIIQKNGVPAGSDSHLDSNVSLVVRPDGNFEIVQRHGLIALSKTGICGPYLMQQPTNTYPSNEQPPSSIASIYPDRQTHSDPLAGTPNGPPVTPESTYTLAEDPVIWFSGGQYHVLYDYPDDRVGYHLASPDGIHNWTDEGLAYDPRDAQQLFGYVDDAGVVAWYKMERPDVLIENGHVTHLTWAVSDVDKNDEIPAGSDHGSKVIVVPFDGVLFDCETGNGGCDAGGGGGDSGDAGRIDGGASDATVGDATVGDATIGDATVGSATIGDATVGGATVGDASVGDASVGDTGSQDARELDVRGDSGPGPENSASGTGCDCEVGARVPAGPPAGSLIAAAFGAWLRARVRRKRRSALG